MFHDIFSNIMRERNMIKLIKNSQMFCFKSFQALIKTKIIDTGGSFGEILFLLFILIYNYLSQF